MTGNGSCRGLSKFTQEYYLKAIYDDFGKEQLKESLKAFWLLIEKLENQKNATIQPMRAIYEKYIKLV